jgi:hypothetical protein
MVKYCREKKNKIRSETFQDRIIHNYFYLIKIEML